MLEIEGMIVRYGEVTALRSVSLDVARGEVVTVLGANGAGKSSMLNAIAGLVPAAAGRIAMGGDDITGLRAEARQRRGLALVPEGRRVFTRLSIEENLIMGGFHCTRAEMHSRRDEVYELFPVLRERRRGFAGFLSGGEQQMLAIGRALMSRPSVLLLDEPSAGLSPIAIKGVYAALREYIERTGATILLVEQDSHQALRVASRGYVLELGEIKLSGTSEELRSEERVRDLYLGQGATDGGGVLSV